MSKVIEINEYKRDKEIDASADDILTAWREAFAKDDSLKKSISKTVKSIREAELGEDNTAPFDEWGFIDSFINGYFAGWNAAIKKCIKDVEKHFPEVVGATGGPGHELV